MGKVKDLTDMIFGRLTVIERDFAVEAIRRKLGDTRAYWKCRCRCDEKIITVSSKLLLNGHTTSCGCYRAEKVKEKRPTADHSKDIQGQKFAHLTAQKRLQKNIHNIYEWECLCDCGRTTIATTNDLSQLHKTQCEYCSLHSKMSLGEQKIYNLLNENNISFIQEKTFDTCRFPQTNGILRYDFYLPEQHYLIEFDGEQHFTDKYDVWNDANRHNRDNYKNQWCKENNIPLIRIPYTHLNKITIDDLLLETTQFQI